MNRGYILLRTDEDGTIVAMDKAVGLRQVRKRLMNLTALKRRQYLIYDPTEAKFVEPFKNLLTRASFRTASSTGVPLTRPQGSRRRTIKR